MKLILAQISLTTTNLKANYEKIIKTCNDYEDSNTIIVFPELSITGYPLEDLVNHQGFNIEANKFLKHLLLYSLDKQVTIVITHPYSKSNAKKIYNCLFVIEKGKILKKIYKTILPNYGVFDEKRNFSSGKNNTPFLWNGKKLGFLICEDMWGTNVAKKLKKLGAEVLISVNASPFDQDKAAKRHQIAYKIVKQNALPLFYVNHFTAHDELVFDGGSFALDSNGKYIIKPIFWQEKNFSINLQSALYKNLQPIKESNFLKNTTDCKLKHMYNALILGLRNYVLNNNFQKVIVAISGGIDSALVATLAADALGHTNVILVRLPSIYSSDHSLKDAQILANNLECSAFTLSINEIFQAIDLTLSNTLSEKQNIDITHQNIQSRIRGILMMALSNNLEAMLLSTGNKSEYACGYATLYGDMCGGFAPIKDIYKTTVYELCNFRNNTVPKLSMFPKINIIPQNSILKSPSAELKPDQFDTDTLPDYKLLDKILYQFIEENLPTTRIINLGYDQDLVKRIAKLVKIAEYKRKQSPIGTKVSVKNFSKDRRYPITNFYS